MTAPLDPVETAEAILEAEADTVRREALAAIEAAIAKVRQLIDEVVRIWARLRVALIAAEWMDTNGRLVERRPRRAAVHCRRRSNP